MKLSLTFLFFFSLSIVASGCSKNDTPPAADQGNSGNLTKDHSENRQEENREESEGEADEAPTEFKVSDLLQTAVKATTRFERLAISDSEVFRVKTWKSEAYAWARLTYKISNSSTEEQLFLACHFHGDELGCHKKDQSDESEPEDSPADSELPPVEPEELPLNL